jgi:hypothetical protein
MQSASCSNESPGWFTAKDRGAVAAVQLKSCANRGDVTADEFIARCSAFFRFLLHPSYSPDGPSVPPQAHLRCSNPLLRTRVKDEMESVAASAWNLAVAALIHSPPALANCAAMPSCTAFEF